LREINVETSLGSVDELATLDNELDDTANPWQDELGDRILQIIDRKKSSFAEREEALTSYVRILSSRYAKEETYPRKSELIDAFLKSVKAGKTEREGLLAAKGMYTLLVPIAQHKG
jgi:hypothetical protein